MTTASRTYLEAMAAISALLTLVGCEQRADNPEPANTSVEGQTKAAPASEILASPSETPSGPALTQVNTGQSSQGSSKRDCTFVVDGKTVVEGRCLVFPMGDGGYTLNAWSDGKPAQSHFAVVSTNSDGTANVTWNADPDDDRAADSLGIAHLKGGCWLNERIRICAR